MVSLTMMARLLEALRPDTRLILVGDPDQLTSVEAGAVLADLVEGLGERGDSRVAELTTSHRFGESIGLLAQAIREGDADRVLGMLAAGGEHIEFVTGGDPVARLRDVLLPHALRVRTAAASGAVPSALAALDEHRLLCAHRDGPVGVRHWNRQVQRWLTEETGEPIWADWYPGRPVLVTANDYGLGLYNGDTGVTVLADGAMRVAIAGADKVQDFATSRLADVETMHAMTIHKSQGSQADEITVLLPPEESQVVVARALLHGGHPREVPDPHRRNRGGGACRSGPPGGAGHRTASASRRELNPAVAEIDEMALCTRTFAPKRTFRRWAGRPHRNAGQPPPEAGAALSVVRQAAGGAPLSTRCRSGTICCNCCPQ